MNALSKEELRDARLRALGAGGNTANNASTNSSAIPSSSGNVDNMFSEKTDTVFEKTVFDDMTRIMYRGGGATEEDMKRWHHQGFQFTEQPCFGLRQGNGGPCGILAAVQAEIVKDILFDDRKQQKLNTFPALSSAELESLLTKALGNILKRSSKDSIYRIVELPYDSNSKNLKTISKCIHSDYIIHAFSSLIAATEWISGHIHYYQSQYGCILFLMSVMCTRGLESIRTDMDDPSNTLIGQFGHCNQDLINLLLTGAATSNVIDGEMELGDSGLKIRGVYKKTEIGYLTHLEALRYCEVGSYLKIPEYPVWVIGSSSHFTVLFTMNNQINEESQSDKLLSTLQRAFKSVDTNECGFIPTDSLKLALEQININSEYDENPILKIIHDDFDLARLRGFLQIDGDIIIWSSFWVNISKIMTGDSLDSIITCSSEKINGTSPLTGNLQGDNYVMDLSGQVYNESSNSIESSARMRSDSEIARELQMQLDSDMIEGITGAANSNPSTPPRYVQTFSPNFRNSQTQVAATNPKEDGEVRMRSDSEIARDLQNQWDQEDGKDVWNLPDMIDINSDVAATNSGGVSMMNQHNYIPTAFQSTVPMSAERKRDLSDNQATPVMAKKTAVHRSDSLAGDDAKEFIMYHFNGLENAGRQAKLTTFKLFPRSSVNAVGQLIAFAGGENQSASGSFICPIEEVLRTRWAGCRVNWIGQNPPSID